MDIAERSVEMSRRSSVFQKASRHLRLLRFQNIGDTATECSHGFIKIFDAIFAGARPPAFIPLVLGEPAELFIDRHQQRTRRMEAALLSVLIHASIILLAILLVHKNKAALPMNENMVIISAPFFDLSNEDEGEASGTRGGGVTGGGGKNEPSPPAWGGLPNAGQMQLLPPDPREPQPLIPRDDMITISAGIEMPMEIVRDLSIPIGDPDVPYNNSTTSGPGHGGGIGGKNGSGIGSENGPGYGSVEKGTGGPHGKGLYPPGTAGLTRPEIMFDPKPEYTDFARKSRIEGTVWLQVVVRKDGSVDSFQVLRGLGYGLDDSAIRTIEAKWRFKPGRLNGVPVDVPITIEVIFHLY
jgi:TonB family protein